ncbi:MAG: hypothetical protein NWF00_12615 [Candidatus Bathyarchaeota archaeon]|nr:hypothetical protein [Candidatus Bathyarchaeota archaeon]
MMDTKFNWVGVAGGAATLALIVVSWFVPWWRLTMGSPAFIEANFSPVNLNFAFFGSALTIPLIWAMNIAILLFLASGGIIMLIYSVMPNKPYSQRLLGFSYNKPLLAVLFFILEILALVILANGVVGFSVPMMGSVIVSRPPSMAAGANISVEVLTAFGWPFYFAIVVSAICIGARLFHRRIA